MRENGPVVVGIDGSTSSRDALRWAARFARTEGADLRAVTAWDLGPNLGLPLAFDDHDVDRYRDSARAMLHQTISAVLGEGAEVEESVVRGSPAAVMLDAAEKASLLVVGSRGHGAFAGMLLGSVSQHCVAHATCPVVVVPHEE